MDQQFEIETKKGKVTVMSRAEYPYTQYVKCSTDVMTVYYQFIKENGEVLNGNYVMRATLDPWFNDKKMLSFIENIRIPNALDEEFKEKGYEWIAEPFRKFLISLLDKEMELQKEQVKVIAMYRPREIELTFFTKNRSESGSSYLPWIVTIPIEDWPIDWIRPKLYIRYLPTGDYINFHKLPGFIRGMVRREHEKFLDKKANQKDPEMKGNWFTNLWR